jgi:hypothetical protein
MQQGMQMHSSMPAPHSYHPVHQLGFKDATTADQFASKQVSLTKSEIF